MTYNLQGARSANASTAVVRTLDPKGPAANLTDAVQRLLNSKSSLALIGETPSIILQYHAHKDQLKLLPDVLASSYYGFAVKFGTYLRCRESKSPRTTIKFRSLDKS